MLRSRNFNTHIQPQLDEMISDKLNESCPPECLLKPLRNKADWHKASEYKRVTLHHGKASMSIQGWIDAAEVLADVEAFNDDLITQIRNTIERQWEIRMAELAEDLRNEHELIMRRVAVA